MTPQNKETDTHIYFLTNWLSNWKAAEINDSLVLLRFPNTEQAYMFYKAFVFEDRETCKKLTNFELSPAEAKNLGRQVKNFDPSQWDLYKYQAMLYVNLLKYSQNEDLYEKLLNTGSKILVEANPKDCIWGVGLSYDDPLILDEKNWRGQNLLGKVLMDVRRNLLFAKKTSYIAQKLMLNE